MPVVSVVLATFNRVRLLGGAIDSLRRQTLSDWELVAVDDGSTDETPEVLRAAAEADSRIRIIRQQNAGLARALNAGIESARGEFVVFQDDDDFSHPNRLRELTAAMQYNPDAQAATALAQTFSAKDEKTIGRRMFNFKCALFRRRVLREAGGFRPFFRICDDTDLQLRLEERGFSCARVDAALYFIRIGDCSRLSVADDSVLYRFVMFASARARSLGLPDPVVDGKPFDEVLAECKKIPDIFRDSKIAANVLRGHRAQLRDIRARDGDDSAARVWKSARDAMRRCGYSEAEIRAAISRMRRSLWAMKAREWGRRLRGDAPLRVPVAECLRIGGDLDGVK